MPTDDIRPYGSSPGLGYYWVRKQNAVGRFVSGYLALVAIDEVGKATDTGSRRDDDEAAPSQAEAVLEHMAGAISEADARFSRRKASLPTDPGPSEPPLDPATQRFLETE